MSRSSVLTILLAVIAALLAGNIVRPAIADGPTQTTDAGTTYKTYMIAVPDGGVTSQPMGGSVHIGNANALLFHLQDGTQELRAVVPCSLISGKWQFGGSTQSLCLFYQDPPVPAATATSSP